jgi:hypothetical protein
LSITPSHHRTSIAPALHHHHTTITPPSHQHHTTITPPSHHHHTITPSHHHTITITIQDRVRVVVAHFVTIHLALNSTFQLNCQHTFNFLAAGWRKFTSLSTLLYVRYVLELEIKHKHGAFNINYEKLLWYGNSPGSDRNPNSSEKPVRLSVQSYGTYCQHTLSIFPLKNALFEHP